MPSLLAPTENSWFVFGDLSGTIMILNYNYYTRQCRLIAKFRFDDSNLYIKSFGMADGKIFVLTSKKMGPSGNTAEIMFLDIRLC